MKIGSLVKTCNDRIGIIKSYHPSDGPGTDYPWYVYMMDRNWSIEYFRTEDLEVISV